MPLGPETWIHCYGVPVVFRYGPLSHHYGIAIPKQHPYRPYHSLSLAHEYVELDRAARVIIELARKVISAAPPPPTDETRDMYMVGLRLYIVEEAVKQGYWQKLETAKIKCKARQAAFFHCKTTSTEKRIARDGPEAQASRKESRVEGGKAAAERYVSLPDSNMLRREHNADFLLCYLLTAANLQQYEPRAARLAKNASTGSRTSSMT